MSLSFKDIVDLIRAVAWPAVTMVLAILFRRELKNVASAVAEKATKVSALGVSVEMAAKEVKNDRLGEESPVRDKANALEAVDVAKAIVPKFDFWMKNHRLERAKPDRELLLDWIRVDPTAATYLSRDYDVFKALAEVLAKTGYNTSPLPSEAEFRVALSDAERCAMSRINDR
jgi:hypothetical protein